MSMPASAQGGQRGAAVTGERPVQFTDGEIIDLLAHCVDDGATAMLTRDNPAIYDSVYLLRGAAACRTGGDWMPDVYSNIAALDAAMQDRLADILETRGADRQQQELRRVFLAAIPFPAEARVLEIGCGTGVLTRMIGRWPGVGEVVGVDPAPSLLGRARALAAELPNVRFEQGDGRSLPFDAQSFDVVVFDSTLSHVPEPERALAEAHRVLRPLGWVATFDGDYSTTTVALGDHDPLQACADMTMANSVHDRWLMRRLASLVRDCGFEVMDFRSHGFLETHGGYMLTVIDRGADMLCGSGQISAETAAALKAEACRRSATGAFFGHIAYVSLLARKPA